MYYTIYIHLYIYIYIFYLYIYILIIYIYVSIFNCILCFRTIARIKFQICSYIQSFVSDLIEALKTLNCTCTFKASPNTFLKVWTFISISVSY